jgi:hypothetical protein
VVPQIAEENPKYARNIGAKLHGVACKKMAVFIDSTVISLNNALN